MLEIAELGVAHDWREASVGRRAALGFEGLLAVVLGVRVPVAGLWWFLQP